MPVLIKLKEPGDPLCFVTRCTRPVTHRLSYQKSAGQWTGEGGPLPGKMQSRFFCDAHLANASERSKEGYGTSHNKRTRF